MPGSPTPTSKRASPDLGGTVLPGSPADFGKLIVEIRELGPRLSKFAGIKAD